MIMLITALLQIGVGPLASAAEKEIYDKEVYVWIGGLLDAPYFIDHRLGIEAIGRELGVTTKFIGPKGYDLKEIIKLIETEIDKRPAGLAIIGFAVELAPAINKAIKKGIPVVTLDADLASSNRITFLGTNNYQAGRIIGKLLGQSVNGEGQVAVLFNLGHTNLTERLKGLQDELKERFPKVRIVQVIETKGNSKRAESGVKAVLLAHPKLAGIAALDAMGGKGAARAALALKREGTVQIISMDRDDETLKYIEDGIILYSVAQRTAVMGYLGVKLLHQYHHRNISITEDDEKAGVHSLPSVIDTGTIIINTENAKHFYHSPDAKIIEDSTEE